MRTQITWCITTLLACGFATAQAQETHVVEVMSNFFDPDQITIQAGDTVRWVNPPDDGFHNVLSEDQVFSSGIVADSWEYEFTFTEGGEYPYYCQPHRLAGMTGNVTVEGSVEPPIAFNAGHNGNWWNGLARDGEGAQIEVSDAGDGQLVFVVTIYSYGPEGGQIFMIGVGTPEDNTVEVEVFITDGGVWGEEFDPADVDQTPWGTGIFTADGCDLILMELTPNAQYEALGYTDLAYELIRLTAPLVPCPYEAAD